MKVAIAADHAGLPLRPTIAEAVRGAGHEPLLYGPDTAPPRQMDLCRSPHKAKLWPATDTQPGSGYATPRGWAGYGLRKTEARVREVVECVNRSG